MAQSARRRMRVRSMGQSNGSAMITSVVVAAGGDASALRLGRFAGRFAGAGAVTCTSGCGGGSSAEAPASTRIGLTLMVAGAGVGVGAGGVAGGDAVLPVFMRSTAAT